MSKFWPQKDPSAVEPFFVVWCDPSGSNVNGDGGELQGATISTVTWTVPTGITRDSSNQNAVVIGGVSYSANTVCTIWLSGGTVHTSYTLTCRITTSDGRTLDQLCTIMVEEQ
jgi:hypothetical protein